eukprot:115673-Amphidinium_carterae.1
MRTPAGLLCNCSAVQLWVMRVSQKRGCAQERGSLDGCRVAAGVGFGARASDSLETPRLCCSFMIVFGTPLRVSFATSASSVRSGSRADCIREELDRGSDIVHRRLCHVHRAASVAPACADRPGLVLAALLNVVVVICGALSTACTGSAFKDDFGPQSVSTRARLLLFASSTGCTAYNSKKTSYNRNS